MEIPERSWAYKLAKRFAFHDYGTYTRHFDEKQWHDPEAHEAPRRSMPIVDLPSPGSSTSENATH